jgi:phospholipid-binding lipoprotein MlaA
MKRLLALLVVILATGCATTGGEADERDPFEGFNRGVFKFNDALDNAVVRPVASTYRDWVHPEIRDRVRNFFANIAEPVIGVNNILQGKFEDGFLDFMRFAFNSTVGLFGLHDIATDMGYEKHDEDFGQTFGVWGFGSGPYLVLPFLGPSSIRDGAGVTANLFADPLTHVSPDALQISAYALRFIQVRSDLLDATRLLEEAALDRYVFLRDAYLQRRRNQVYDGRPPREEAR